MALGELVLAMLPGALAIAASPVPVLAVVLLLVSRRGNGPAIAYTAGIVLTVGVAVAVAALVGGLLPERAGRGPDPIRGWITVGCGVLLLGFAVQQWVRRRRPDGTPASAGWSRVFDGVTSGHAVLLGVAQVLVNPKNVVLVLTSGLVLGESAAPVVVDALAVVLFAVVGASTVIVPVVWRLVSPSSSTRVLGSVRRWLLLHGVGLLVVVLVLLGIGLVVSGLAAV